MAKQPQSQKTSGTPAIAPPDVSKKAGFTTGGAMAPGYPQHNGIHFPSPVEEDGEMPDEALSGVVPFTPVETRHALSLQSTIHPPPVGYCLLSLTHLCAAAI